ncbi:MAG: triose-phosphate isomerase, partial [Bacteroidota bacterium]
QLSGSLVGLEDASRLAIAYEPVWAIGTGETATPEQARETHALIRGWLSDRFGEAGTEVPILYGGSVRPANADDLFSQPDVDGGLVGGASLDAGSFVEIVRAAERARG